MCKDLFIEDDFFTKSKRYYFVFMANLKSFMSYKYSMINKMLRFSINEITSVIAPIYYSRFC